LNPITERDIVLNLFLDFEAALKEFQRATEIDRRNAAPLYNEDLRAAYLGHLHAELAKVTAPSESEH
jgi:hypothetical protein